MTVLLTGCAGFIGMHVAERLLDAGRAVVGVDNMNAYYDPALKTARLDRRRGRDGFHFVEADIADRAAMDQLFASQSDIDAVISLAAQAGVRHSLIDPYVYVTANVMGQIVLMEAARRRDGVRQFVYASSSSVYGANEAVPFSVDDRVDQPVSLYAATKRACELTAHTYAHLYRLPCTGLRFFTVYGPWGRPDMAAWLFADAILAGRPIQVFNNGDMRRDFTYIDDVVAGVIAALDRPPADDGARPPWRVYNLGNNTPELLERFIATLEDKLGRKAVRENAPMQPGDVQATYA
ncbi:MAG: SDR family NAD(P)-dependent oxidoreductase, partial [Pseudomonadota bacterium]